MQETFHSNMFALKNARPLPLFTYNVVVDPSPEKKPLYYKILGVIAKRLARAERKAVISDRGQIKVLGTPLAKGVLIQKVSIENLGKFTAKLEFFEEKESTLKDFEEYRHLVNRVIDVALTDLSEEYYKYHPEAPYIVKDYPFFDKALIEDTGVVDFKEYFRNVRIFHNKPYMIFNLGTRLKSFENLLTELKCLSNKFGKIRNQQINFHNPTEDFIGFINSLFRGKAANVIGYPGPSVKRIKEITWKYRCGDVPPNAPMSPCKYLRTNYGLTGLDKNQPLVIYEIRVDNGNLVQYHVPEVLSVGHNLKDLKIRIPTWQRTKVWDIINPDCKSQLREIISIAEEVDSVLRSKMSEIYPSKIEIETVPINVTSDVTFHKEISISFKNKNITLQPPYDEAFYRRYRARIRFLNPVDRDIKSLVFIEKRKQNVKEFFDELQEEFKKRNGTRLIVEYGNIDFEAKNFLDYDLVITVTDSEDIYTKSKKIIQNECSILHQNIKPENVTSDSIMQLVMQITLMFGGDPWLLKEDDERSPIFGIHFYRSPFTGAEKYFLNLSNGAGKILFQSRPYLKEDFDILFNDLATRVSEYKRTLLLLSFDYKEPCQSIAEKIEKIEGLDYVVLLVKNWDNLRIFKTWIPKRIELPQRIRKRRTRYPVEAYEAAPQGIALDAGDDTYHLVTSYSVRRQTILRGCPIPIRIEIFKSRGTFDTAQVLSHLMSLTFMFRGSGHSTRLPAPLVYLKKYAYYVENFGMPSNEEFAQKLFYL